MSEGVPVSEIEFDRWLAAERAKAWDEGHAQALANIAWPKERSGNPYREVQ